MKVTHVRWPLIGLLFLWLILAVKFSSDSVTIGFSVESVNGNYRVAGGTHPAELGLSILILIFYVFLIDSDRGEHGAPVSGVFRRFMAFWVDFIFGFTAVVGLLGIIPAIVEWRRTGADFQWTFERSTPAPGDTFQALALVGITFAALILYYAFPLYRRCPTPGACIMGYTVVPDEGTTLTFPRALLRTLLGFVAVCGWYVAPFVGRKPKQGKFWVDTVFSTRAITLRNPRLSS